MIWLLFACGPKSPEGAESTPEVNTVEPSAVNVAVEKEPTVLLDGTEIIVDWDDGDTFHGKAPNGDKIKARLNGYNTLESYGPVHQWGDWTEAELYAIAKEAGVFAASQVWTCTDTQKGGGYGRALVDCPELRIQMLERGFAHPFSVGGVAPEEDMVALRKGIENKAGMWAKGAPKMLITSLHSQDEKEGEAVYNRVCDLSTGECGERSHTDTYTSCQKVCMDDSCMTYVPYKERYGDSKAACLQ